MSRAMYDTSVPALLLTVGPHPWDYGAVATARTLGRVGVPVFVAVADPTMPAARSKYVTTTIAWDTTGAEEPGALAAAVRRMTDRIGHPVVAIAGDDETAVLVAEYASELAPGLLTAPVPPDLPARLASKGGLAHLCRDTGTPTPLSATPHDWADVDAFLASAAFPLVVKNPDPFGRLVAPAVARTTRVADDTELRLALEQWRPGVPLLLQEFVPEDASEDWYVEAVFDASSEVVVAFSGRKLRAYPESTGVGTLSEAVINEGLLELAGRFARDIGYVGVCDMDWRLDHRDGTYKLLDFNPRRGAQFRLFHSTAGIDVVRALHLMLTGRPVPQARQVEGVRHVVGLQDQRAYVAQRRVGRPAFGLLQRPGSERAWWAWDDPTPALAFISDLGVVKRLTRR